MHRLSAAQLEVGKRVLAHEASAGGADGSTAAGRTYDRLVAQIAPLLGAAGADLLFVRSAKLLEQGDFTFLADVSILDGSAKLRDCLHARAPAIAPESAAALFGTFLALLTKFIGERLTTQVLRRAWPTLEESAGETSR